jgi:hypothetical protein
MIACPVYDLRAVVARRSGYKTLPQCLWIQEMLLEHAPLGEGGRERGNRCQEENLHFQLIAIIMWSILYIASTCLEMAMKTVQMTLDEELIAAVDAATRRFGTTRSAFTRDALRHELDRRRYQVMEERQIDGYRREPVRPGEFDIWHDEQAWGGT